MDLSFVAHGLGAHDLALALTRIGVGTFFTISGYHKLVNTERHQRLFRTLVADKVPFPTFNQWWVPCWELIAGLWLAIGFVTAFSAGVLIIICLVATACEACAKVESYNPIDWADRLDDWLYLPEVLYVFLLAVNMLAGGGAYSIDAVLFPRAAAVQAVPVFDMPTTPGTKKVTT